MSPIGFDLWENLCITQILSGREKTVNILKTIKADITTVADVQAIVNAVNIPVL